jgi:ADP-ribosyl-[dinitrogen reductase] hydrolase
MNVLHEPHYRPISYIKVSILWAFYYLKHEYNFTDAIKDMISKGGDTEANAAIIGGLIGAASGIRDIKRQHIDKALTIQE